jgi:hypothetical protein
MKHGVVALVAAILLLNLASGSTLALVFSVLDQENLNDGGSFSGSYLLAQSVTAGMAGTLTEVDLYMSDSAPGGGHVPVSIDGYARATGEPDDNTLSSGEAHVSSAGWYSFQLAPAVNLLAGGHFTIVVYTSATQTIFHSGNLYPGGETWEKLGGQGGVWMSTGGDLEFRTWMGPPAPTPTPKPTPKPTPTPKPAPTAPPSAIASPTPVESHTGTAEATASAGEASPAATAGAGSETGSGGATDWTLPAALAVIAVLAIGFGGWYLLARRRRRQNGGQS